MNTVKLALMALMLVLVAMVLGGCGPRYRYIDATRRCNQPYVQNGTEITHVLGQEVVTFYGPKGSAENRVWRDRHYPRLGREPELRLPVRVDRPMWVTYRGKRYWVTPEQPLSERRVP